MISLVKKDYDSTKIYRNTQKRVRHRLMTHPLRWTMKLASFANEAYCICSWGRSSKWQLLILGSCPET